MSAEIVALRSNRGGSPANGDLPFVGTDELIRNQWDNKRGLAHALVTLFCQYLGENNRTIVHDPETGKHVPNGAMLRVAASIGLAVGQATNPHDLAIRLGRIEL